MNNLFLYLRCICILKGWWGVMYKKMFTVLKCGALCVRFKHGDELNSLAWGQFQLKFEGGKQKIPWGQIKFVAKTWGQIV